MDFVSFMLKLLAGREEISDEEGPTASEAGASVPCPVLRAASVKLFESWSSVEASDVVTLSPAVLILVWFWDSASMSCWPSEVNETSLSLV